VKIAAVGRAFPDHHYDQDALLDAFLHHWGAKHHNVDRLAQLYRSLRVEGRYLALPMERYPKLSGWGDANDHWIDIAQDVGGRAVTEVLMKSGIDPETLGAFFSVTVTGIATPSLEARLMNRLSLPTHLKRVPIFGLGCVAGAAGIARAADYVRAFPRQAALLLSVELCSLTLQREDLSIANLIATGLFGDGAAAAIVLGDQHPAYPDPKGPKVVATRSHFYPDTERVMGWDVSERGFKVVLSAEVPAMVRDHLAGDVVRFLGDHNLETADIKKWICHPGGPRVLEAMQAALSLPDDALLSSWNHLHAIGNLSSSSVLMILEDALLDPPNPGEYGLILAMGPAFGSELVLVQW
jgi:alkylresorcinol/alkylpyrone synthase